MKLFEDDFEINESPVDNTEITTTLLYFSKEELKEFKLLCKKGIKAEHPDDFLKKGNISDLLLNLLRKNYGS